MTLADLVMAVMWVGVTLYAVFAGADFGAGVWDLLAGGAGRGRRPRELIEHSIGPVWEANHVWLIFVLVVLWTGFPRAFAAIMSNLYVPLTAAAIGIIARGSAFAFRKAVTTLEFRRLFGATFALASLLTPFFLGAVAGGVASGRVDVRANPPEPFQGWVHPTAFAGGVLAVVTCAYLAAVFLCADAARQDQRQLAEHFRRRALVAGGISGVVAVAATGVLHASAPALYRGLMGRAALLVAASALCGGGSLVLLVRRDYRLARVAAASTIVAGTWAWAVGQYPYVLVNHLTIEDAAGSRATLQAMLISLGVGAALFGPALIALYVLSVRDKLGADAARITDAGQ